MTRLGVEITYYVAYCLFLFGASRSFRDNASRSSILIMTLGVLTDVSITLLRSIGIPFFQVDWKGTNSVIMFAIAFGVLFVWILFPVALITWRMGKKRLFHSIITVIEIGWFIDLVLFMYGLYKYPLK